MIAAGPIDPALYPPAPSVDAQLAHRITHVIHCMRLSLTDVAAATGICETALIDICSGTAPVTLAQALAIADVTGQHIMAFVDGITATPAFIHPAFMDREAGDLALRLMQMPKVGRAMALAIATKETS